MAGQTKIKKISERYDLLSLDEALDLYEKRRLENNWPEELKVSKRTFRFWNSKNLVFPSHRGRYNRAFFPETVVDDIYLVRLYQASYGLTINQIKEMYEGLSVGYFEGIQNVKDISDQKKMEATLKDNHPDKISIVRGILRKNIPGYQDRKRYKDYLKQLAVLYKEFDEKMYYQYLGKSGDELFQIAVNEYEKIDDDDIDIIEAAQARFITDLLHIVALVRRENRNPRKGLEFLLEAKPYIYRTCKSLFEIHRLRREIVEKRSSKTNKK